MILSGKEIVKEQELGNIVLEPFDLNKVNPNSYNLTLHEELLVYEKGVILDMKRDNQTNTYHIPDEGFTLYPGELYLGRTNERTFTDKYVPMLEGRSSLGRLGLDIHVSAGFGDIGFDGFWTLELRVVRPLIIYPNIDICQIYYHSIQGDYDLYDGKYQNARTVEASKMSRDFMK